MSVKGTVTLLVGVLVVAAGGAGAFGYGRMVDQAKVQKIAAGRALMQSEELVWTLEGECLKDATPILEGKAVKAIAEHAGENAEEAERVESRLREYLRIRRSKEVLEAAKRAFVTMTPDSRALTDKAASDAGVRPVDVLAEWMTYEAGLDLFLMTKVWTDRATFPPQAQAVVGTFFDKGAEAPGAKHGVEIVSHQDDRIVINLFGAKVIEECIPGGTELLAGGKANVHWKSNYNFLRDMVRGNAPKEIEEQALVRSDDGYGVEYVDDINEYLAGGNKQRWVTLVVLKGPLAIGELAKDEDKKEGEKKEGEKGEKKEPTKEDRK